MSKKCIKCNGELAMIDTNNQGKPLPKKDIKYHCKDARCALGGQYQNGLFTSCKCGKNE